MRLSVITLFFSLAALTAANIANDEVLAKDSPSSLPLPAPTLNPAASKKLSPEMAEYFNLCNFGGGGLKPTVTNPSCSAYRLNEVFNLANIAKYRAGYSTYCTENSVGTFRCLFRFPKLTCRAYVDVHNQLMDGAGHPWKATPIKNSQGGYQCFYCWTDESTGQFEPTNATAPDGTKYCSANGGFDITYDDPVPPVDQSEFCSVQVEGPYSNFPDEYSVCGGTESQAYSGMVFAISQKDQIRQINKLGNDLNPNGSELRSDLAGFCYPKPKGGECVAGHEVNATTCREPAVLTQTPYQKNSAQIHHIVPRKDGSGCPCGKNSMKNAAVISAQLNRYFSNKDLTTLKNACGDMKTEQEVIEAMGKYSLLNEIVFRLNRARKYDAAVWQKVIKRKTKVPDPRQLRGGRKRNS